MLLAISVLAILAGTTIPAALTLYQQSQVAEVVEKVRGQFAGARARAIEAGLIYQFRIEPEGRAFVVVPFEREIDAATTANTGTGATTGVGQFSKFAGELPEGYRFVACCGTLAAASQSLSEAALTGLPNAAELAGRTWSAPVLFFPNGSAGGDAAFEVVNQRQQASKLSVRGLTGSVTVGRVTGEGA
jgi:hypothetical protein